MTRFAISSTDLTLLEIETSVAFKRRKADLLVGLLVFVVCNLVGFLLVRVSAGFLVLIGAGFVGTWCASRTERLVRREARRYRQHLELATAVFLELVNVMMAGGAGLETAIRAAAEAGDGPGFTHLRIAVMRAHSSRTSYWDSLATVGHETGVESLVEVAHTMQLAGEGGARVRSSLAAKASALRKRNLARVEHSAEEGTEKMGLPLVVLFVGFLVLVGFPAFSQTMSTL